MKRNHSYKVLATLILVGAGALAALLWVTAPTGFGPDGDAFLEWCRGQQAQALEYSGRIKSAEAQSPALRILEWSNELEIAISDADGKSELYHDVHPDSGVREAAAICAQEISELSSSLALDHELYAAFSRIVPGKAGLDALDLRYLEKTLEDFQRNGVHREEKIRERIQQLQRKSTELEQAFESNLAEDTRYVEIRDVSKLAGLPQDFIDSHGPDENGVIRVGTDWNDYIAVMQFAKDADLREKLWRLGWDLGYPKNDPIFKELLTVRKELAELIGYESWAAYATEDQMTGSPDTVHTFIDRVADLARPIAQKELEVLLARKRREQADAAQVLPWEKSYLSREVREERFGFDPQTVRPYFEVARIKQGVLAISSDLFGLKFRAVPDAEVWEERVEVYDVFSDGTRIGRIYFDLFPREGKYKGFAQFDLIRGVAGRRIPEAVIVANFPDPEKGGGKAFFDHEDVVTFFHEFGHLLHAILSGHHKWVRFSGTVEEWDFIEVPSTLYEEWAWDGEILRRFALNEQGRPIPKELIAQMNEARTFGQAIGTMQQMYYAAVSLGLHEQSPENLDLHRFEADRKQAYSMFAPIEGAHMVSSFDHLMGYTSNYYTYMWSQVIARDLFSSFQQRGLTDKAVARKYRETILESGGSLPAEKQVEAFLGRSARFEPFAQWLQAQGGQPAPENTPE